MTLLPYCQGALEMMDAAPLKEGRPPRRSSRAAEGLYDVAQGNASRRRGLVQKVDEHRIVRAGELPREGPRCSPIYSLRIPATCPTIGGFYGRTTGKHVRVGFAISLSPA